MNLGGVQVTGYPETQLSPLPFAQLHNPVPPGTTEQPQSKEMRHGCAQAQDVAREHP